MKDKYLWLAVLLSVLVSLYFFGDVLRSPNEYLFSSSGDGLQTYYQGVYHVKYDSTYWHQQSMNYPHGESIFFTGGQPLVSNTIKLLQPVADFSDYVVGVSNLFMLCSLILCSLFLYLILKRFSVHGLFAALVSVGLTFCSPQMERMGGHYTLAYLYAVPGMIYFLLRYYNNPNWKWSVGIAFYMLFLLFAHIYYLPFFAIIATGFWVVMVLLNRRRGLTVVSSFFHLVLQVCLPFFFLQLFIIASTDVTDRTSIPWGFMEYRSAWASYLFPFGMQYESWFEAMKPKTELNWEGIAYVGGAAIFSLLMVLAYTLRKLLKSGFPKIIAANRLLIAISVSCIFCIALSFAFPFNFKLDNLLYKLGSIQQFRGIGRFAFVAYYLLNIFLIIAFWRIKFKYIWLRMLSSCVLMAILFTDANWRTSQISSKIMNKRENNLIKAKSPLLDKLEVSRYQAILPFPFFHIGSENIGVDATSDWKNYIYNLSIDTSLPTFAASMSRTSISQSFASLALSQELMQPPHLMTQLNDKRSLLLVCDTANMPNHQRKLIAMSRHLFDDGGYSFFETDLDVFNRRHYTDSIMNLDWFSSYQDTITQDLFGNGSSRDIMYDQESNMYTFDQHWLKQKQTPVSSAWLGDTVSISFWIKDFTRDLIPRTSVEILQKRDDEIVDYFNEYAAQNFVGLYENNALIEIEIPISNLTKDLLISFENKLLQGESFVVESMLIRPKHSNCMILHNGNKSINNRIY